MMSVMSCCPPMKNPNAACKEVYFLGLAMTMMKRSEGSVLEVF